MPARTRVLTAVALILTGLLVLIVVVGLIRDRVDPTALAVALLPVICALLLGAGFKFGGTDKGGDEK